MKYQTLLFLFISGTSVQAKAQVLGGFFSQQAKREKLLTEQITALNIQHSLLARGYDIKEEGFKAAHTWKDQSFGLHTAYFESLRQVNPAVSKSRKVREIYDLQQQMTNTFKREQSWQRKEQQLSREETIYFSRVQSNLLKESQQDLRDLTDLLTQGKLQLTDEQRLARLDQLYNSMKDKYAFAGYFTEKCRKLAVSRRQGSEEQSQVKKLYGIH